MRKKFLIHLRVLRVSNSQIGLNMAYWPNESLEALQLTSTLCVTLIPFGLEMVGEGVERKARIGGFGAQADILGSGILLWCG